MLDRSDTFVVAVADDDELYRDYLSSLFANKNWPFFEANNLSTLIGILDNNTVDCVILDYDLGVENGLTIGEAIRQKYQDPPPIIMLSGEGRDGTIVKAFRGGFSDFVSKRSLNAKELLEAVQGAVRRKSIERIQKAELSRLSRVMNFDSMTGLYGIDYIKQRAEELSISATRRGGTYGVIIICVRKLDGIIDTFGINMRDRALRTFAERLKRITREADICGRFTDDSFLYLIDRDATPRSIWNFCERLSRDLAFTANFDEASFTFATNMGMALFPQDGETADAVLSAAQGALMRAQESHLTFAAVSDPDTDIGEPGTPSVVTVPGESRIPGDFNASRDTDRRCEKRLRVVKQGKVITANNNSVVDCRIRDISAHGARIIVNEYYVPPDEFTLLIVGAAAKRSVKVRWRAGCELGVQFDP